MIHLKDNLCNFSMDEWLINYLVCPREHGDLTLKNNTLQCEMGHIYPLVDGIPVMLLEDASPTHGECYMSLKQADESVHAQHTQINNVLINNNVDPFVQTNVAQTCGLLYRPLVDKLTDYPIPELPSLLPEGSGQYFLDIGANWGRWCMSSARKGYFPIGIDPSLDAIKAASRIAKSKGIRGAYVVGDARYLPFPSKCIDIAFSFSVLHHFEKDDMKMVLNEISRTLKKNGISLIQLSNSWGFRNMFIHIKRGFRRKYMFDTQYYSYHKMKRIFEDLIGPTILVPHAYLSTGALMSDLNLLPLKYRLLVRTSEMLVKMSTKMKWMKYFADSFYVKSLCR